MMIYYEATCFCCKKQFKMMEGTRKYQLFKQNMKGKFSCENCDHKIYLEARKNLIAKL